jgi:hypothetical protein
MDSGQMKINDRYAEKGGRESGAGSREFFFPGS